MSISLYPHQEKQVQKLRQAMRRSKRILMQSPTGSGKSVMAAFMTASAIQKGHGSAFVVPRRELLRQMKDTFDDFDIAYSHVANGYAFDPEAHTHIASLMSLRNKVSFITPKVVFIDETHFGSNALDAVIDYYTKLGCWIIGLSATPVKLSGQGLGCWYDEMVEGESVRWLIDNGWLSDYRAYAPSHVDMSGIKTVAGDYAKGQLAEKMENDRVLIGNAVKHYKEHADGKLNVSYCVGIKHAQIVAQGFRDEGVSAMCISGKTPDAERRRIIKAFAKREIKVLTNADLLTFGFDLASNAGVKDVTVECMSDLRPTKSLALQCQKWGRVLRRKDYPALIFDHANNFNTHGMPCDDREWTLEDQKKSSGPRDVLQSVRECPKCYRVHSPSISCPGCGYIYPIEQRSIKEIEGELEEVERVKAKARLRSEVGMAKSIADLKEIQIARGYNRGWVYHMAKIKGIRS